MRARLVASLASTLVFVACAARAAGPLGQDGSAITTSQYRIDLFQGPVLSSSRVTGIAGAYAPLADGVEGYPVNAAAPAVRVPWSYTHFDYDVSAGITFPSSLAKTDFDNNGTTGFRYSNFLFFTAGLNLQLGAWGFGLAIDTQQFTLGSEDVTAKGEQLQSTLTRAHALLARSFLQGQLMIGVGLRFAQLGIGTKGATNDSLFGTTSVGVQAGVLIAPIAMPFRVGLSARGKMVPDTSSAEKFEAQRDKTTGDLVVNGRFFPIAVEIPWEIEGGFAFQIGPRPLNVRWVNPKDLPPDLRYDDDGVEKPANGQAGAPRKVMSNERLKEKLKQRYQALAREKLLVTTSLLVSGPVEDAVGVESFLAQKVERSGRKLSFTPRLGLEAEPFAGVLQVRAGSYLEPTRYAAGKPRPHGTFGFDVKLFSWSAFGLYDADTYWRIGGFVDVANAYLGWGVSAGVWR